MLRSSLGQLCERQALQHLLQLLGSQPHCGAGWGSASASLHPGQHACSSTGLLTSAVPPLACSFASVSQMAKPGAEQVVPAALAQELQQIESSLKRQSCVDGLKRLTMSKDSLPQPIPKHEVEPGLLTINAHVRAVEGSNAMKWLRKAGRTPVRVQSLWPGNKSLLLHIASGDAARLVTRYGRHGCQARVVALRVTHPEDPTCVLGVIRAKPQQVHMSSYRSLLENIDFLYCPQDRLVYVDVPIKLAHDDVAVGVKAGGWMFIAKRTVRYQARGNAIPPFIEVDVRQLDVNQTLKVRDLPIPQGTRLPGPHYHEVVVRCTNETGQETGVA